MKAKIKADYGLVKSGCHFDVVEVFGSRVTLLIDGQKADFGFSEVEIIQGTGDLAELGRELSLIGEKSIPGWREKDVTNYINGLRLPIKKSLARRAINAFVWG